MSDSGSEDKKSSMPSFKVPSEMRLSRKYDEAIERFAISTAAGTGIFVWIWLLSLYLLVILVI